MPNNPAMFKPPFPGAQPSNQAQFNAPPPMGGGQQFGGPPLPGQMNANQLANQMQNMMMAGAGPRQYPGGPQKQEGLMSPGSQQPYLNGQQQQMRSPQGFPPMPGGGAQPQMQPGVGYQQPYQQPQQPQRRLDPDQMPNPVRVFVFLGCLGGFEPKVLRRVWAEIAFSFRVMGFQTVLSQKKVFFIASKLFVVDR